MNEKDFWGVGGFAVKLLWDEVKHVDPLSEKNKIIFSTGPLKTVPSQFRKMVIASKSPLTGDMAMEISEPWQRFISGKQAMMSWLWKGKSEKPCYILIEDEKVRIMDGSELWGKNTFEAQDFSRKSMKELRVLLTGPAGENRSAFSGHVPKGRRWTARTRRGDGV